MADLTYWCESRWGCLQEGMICSIRYNAVHQLPSATVLLQRPSVCLDKLKVCSARRNNSWHCDSKVIFSGIQPTGVPHLGNYLGALRQWKRLQDEASPSTRLLYSVVDLHAITTRQNAGHVREWKRETLAALLAVGLNPKRCTVFFQSAVGKWETLALTVTETKAGCRT